MAWTRFTSARWTYRTQRTPTSALGTTVVGYYDATHRKQRNRCLRSEITMSHACAAATMFIAGRNRRPFAISISITLGLSERRSLSFIPRAKSQELSINYGDSELSQGMASAYVSPLAAGLPITRPINALYEQKMRSKHLTKASPRRHAAYDT
jgi:hypothetical protein